ncbi:MAG: hypothetical protein GOP50_09290 [Candidatus Heimdallarchaeota archaeon]|nr:hypothetical protein [Candidatus Heimdallarchaeota archaeon]
MNVLLTPAKFISEQLEDPDYLKEGIAFAQERIRELEKDNLLLLELLNKSMFLLFDQLNKKQREIFFTGFRILEKKTISLNKLSEIISGKLEMSFSTTKWNITRLRDIGFFETIGSRGNTKTILISTSLGKTFHSFLAQSNGKNL